MADLNVDVETTRGRALARKLRDPLQKALAREDSRERRGLEASRVWIAMAAYEAFCFILAHVGPKDARQGLVSLCCELMPSGVEAMHADLFPDEKD